MLVSFLNQFYTTFSYLFDHLFFHILLIFRSHFLLRFSLTWSFIVFLSFTLSLFQFFFLFVFSYSYWFEHFILKSKCSNISWFLSVENFTLWEDYQESKNDNLAIFKCKNHGRTIHFFRVRIRIASEATWTESRIDRKADLENL